jgi:effector-binding domain-containing protein
MKTLKKSLIILAALIGVLLIIAVFLPSEARVERSIVIDASANEIAANITDLHQWDKWSPWKSADSAAEYKYNDTIGLGAWMEWAGKIVGKGKLTIKKITADSIIYFLAFKEPFESESNGSFSFAQADSGVKVTWTDIESLPWPMGRIMGLFLNFDEMMGPDFEKGLAKLKSTTEESYKYSYEILEKEVSPMTIAVIRNKVKAGEIGEILGKSYGEIQAYIAKHGAKMTGSPMAITLAWDSLSWDFEAAIPIDKEIPGNDKIQIKKSYAGKVIYAEYTGPYTGTYQAYTDLDVYQKKKGYTEAGGPWEVYVTDPGMEPDTSKWITEIYFPVK